MTVPEFQFQLLILWITVTVVALLGLIAVLVWAVRSRQFSNQDRARYLALESGIPKEDSEENKNKDKRSSENV
jgi:cbb3-type cytochrome oxidase maturation protein